MANVKLRDIIILVFVVLIFINYFYYRYIYIPNQSKSKKIITDIENLNAQLTVESERFINNLKIFNKLQEYNNTINQKQLNLWFIKKNINLTDKVSEVINYLFIDSGISLNSLNITDIKKEGSKKFYTINATFTTNLNNLLLLMDTIENHKKPMQINNINISNTERGLSVAMIITLFTMEQQ
ncbi:MAG: hypothetical protein N3C60_08645 [Calditerrivibrio sp.]|nr:hypothetical protein [Calditerrivibrio sp.]